MTYSSAVCLGPVGLGAVAGVQLARLVRGVERSGVTPLVAGMSRPRTRALGGGDGRLVRRGEVGAQALNLLVGQPEEELAERLALLRRDVVAAETVTLIEHRSHSKLERSHWALGFGELLSKLDFEPCNVTPCMCDSGKDVTREQPRRELLGLWRTIASPTARSSAEAIDIAAPHPRAERPMRRSSLTSRLYVRRCD